MQTKRRVVVTGLGLLTPLGHTVENTWSNIVAGQSGISPIERFDTSEFSARIGGAVKDFNVTDYMSSKDARKVDIFVQYGFVAAQQAIQDSGLDLNAINLERAGVAVGSGIGGLPLIEETHTKLMKSGPKRISPFFIPASIINTLPGYISQHFNLKGPNISIVTACTTGTHNIGTAARMIAYGDADVMISGGAEMATSPLGLGGFAVMRALSTRNDQPEQASRPWDRDRDGFVLGDGAGVLVLESYEHAKARGANIYAEVSGFGMSADAYHMTSPDPDGNGFVRVMQAALNDAELNPEQIGYINAHATSTPVGDIIEARAVMQLFGKHKETTCMSGTKSMTGHLLGAAGAIEAIFSVLALRDQVAPPTINLDNVDEGIEFDLVANEAKSTSLTHVLSNSFGFGGTNGSVIFSKV